MPASLPGPRVALPVFAKRIDKVGPAVELQPEFVLVWSGYGRHWNVLAKRSSCAWLAFGSVLRHCNTVITMLTTRCY